jgi:2-hydroxy-6-oxonona-2,4-dienedioate hydrolase
VDIYEDACLRTRFRSKALSLSGDLAQTLRQVAAPVLLIWGAEDVTADRPELFIEKPPDGADYRFEKLSGAGHWVQWESAAQVNDLLEHWFAA